MSSIQLLTDEDLEFFKDEPMLLKEFQTSERKVNEIYKHLLRGETTFVSSNKERELLVHNSPEPSEFKRATTFDKYGPIGHFARDNLKDLAHEIHIYGFQPISRSELNHLY